MINTDSAFAVNVDFLQFVHANADNVKRWDLLAINKIAIRYYLEKCPQLVNDAMENQETVAESDALTFFPKDVEQYLEKLLDQVGPQGVLTAHGMSALCVIRRDEVIDFIVSSGLEPDWVALSRNPAAARLLSHCLSKVCPVGINHNRAMLEVLMNNPSLIDWDVFVGVDYYPIRGSAFMESIVGAPKRTRAEEPMPSAKRVRG